MKYGAYWCVVHNSECDHHNLFLAHSIFLLFFFHSFKPPSTTTPPPLLSPRKYCIHLFDSFSPFSSVALYFTSFFFFFWPPFTPIPIPSISLSLLTYPWHFMLPSLFNALHLPPPLLVFPGQRKPTRPFQRRCRCTTSWWRPGPCGATTWRTSSSRTASSTWESPPLPVTSTHAATKTRASPAST